MRRNPVETGLALVVAAVHAQRHWAAHFRELPEDDGVCGDDQDAQLNLHMMPHHKFKKR